MPAFSDERDADTADGAMAEVLIRMTWLQARGTQELVTGMGGARDRQAQGPDGASPAGILFLDLGPPEL